MTLLWRQWINRALPQVKNEDILVSVIQDQAPWSQPLAVTKCPRIPISAFGQDSSPGRNHWSERIAVVSAIGRDWVPQSRLLANRVVDLGLWTGVRSERLLILGSFQTKSFMER